MYCVSFKMKSFLYIVFSHVFSKQETSSTVLGHHINCRKLELKYKGKHTLNDLISLD